MSIVVQKFGGTSVADATKIRNAAARAVAVHREGHQVVLVVSARGKKTDELVGLAAEITDTPPAREMDVLLSTGEQETIALASMAIQSLGVSAMSFTGGQLGITTDGSHSKARIRSIDTGRIQAALEAGQIVVAAGFQGYDEHGNITTLGRGGSDLTATALAAVLRADVCEIFTDVEGVYTTDPRVVAEARKIEKIAYEEMLELASLGAGVMHSRSIEFAKKYHVPIRVRPALGEGEGTLITALDDQTAPVVTGVALVKSESRVTLLDLPDRPGVMDQIFTQMEERKIPIDMVVQDVGSGGVAEVSFSVPEAELAETLTAAERAVEVLGQGRVVSGTNLSKVSVVGIGMSRHTGVAALMFRTLADAGINIGIVTTSEIKISVLVDRDRSVDAVRAIHKAFALHEEITAEPAVGVRREVGSASIAADAETEDATVRGLAGMEDIVVSEVRLDDLQSRVTFSNVPDRPGVLADLFEAVAEGAVVVDMIVQNVSQQGRANVSFTVLRSDLDRCLLLGREVSETWPNCELSFEKEIAKISVTGIGLRTHTSVGRVMFRALAEQGANISLINTSEVRFSAVVAGDAGKPAVEKVAAAFGLKAR
uniref:aspartate kinase n=1 Tax=Stratiformator vulcanicus TaxID=2527980 RepID=UPI0011A839B3